MPDAKAPSSAIANALKQGSKAKTPAVKSALAKGLPKPADTSAFAPALSAGQTLLNILSTPMYFVEGAFNESLSKVKRGDASGSLMGISPFLGIIANMGAGAQNVSNAFAGKKTVTGHEILQNAGVDKNFGNVPFLGGELNIPGLALDIALDPLTYTPGVVVSAPLKMAAKGASAAGRAAYDAARAMPSLKYVDNVTANVTATKGAKFAKQTPEYPRMVKGESPTLRREATDLGAYAAKNVADRLKARYVAAPVKPGRSVFETAQQVAGSGLEAGFKAAKTSLSESILKHKVQRVNLANAKIIKKADKAGLDAPVLPNTGAAAILVKTEQGKVVLDDGTSVDYPVATPVKQGKSFYVDLDGSGQVYRFSDEKTAKQFIADKTGMPKDAVAKAVEFKAKPVFDTDPALLSPVERAATTQAAPTLIKELQKRIASADKLAKETGGVVSQGTAVSGQIRRILEEARLRAGSGASKLIEGSPAAQLLRKRLKSNEIDASMAFNGLILEKVNPELIRYVRSSPVDLSKVKGAKVGKTTIDAIAGIIKNNGWDALPADWRAAFTAAMNDALSGADMASVAKKMRTDISRIVGDEKLTSEIIAGHNKPAILDEILARIETRDGAVNFKSAEHLISAIASGQATVDPAALLKLAKILSPDATDYAKIAKELKGDVGGMTLAMRNILARDGISTIRSVENRLALLDSDTFADAAGISAKDALAAAIDNAVTGVRVTDELADSATRQAAAERIALADAENISRLSSVVDAFAQGVMGRFGKLMKEDESVRSFVSRMGQGTVAQGNKYLLVQELPANFEVNFLGRYFQSTGFRLGKRVGKAAKAGNAYTPDIKMLDELIDSYGMLRDFMLASFGSRMSHAKAVQRLKAGEEYYWAYVDMGDFASMLKATGNEELFFKAFYPFGMIDDITRKSDWLSPIGIGKAITAAMEATEKGKAVNLKVLTDHILSTADTQLARSKAYEPIAKEIAPRIAKTIAENVDYFTKQHIARMTAEVNDGAVPAQNFMYETLDTILRTVKLHNDRGTLTAAEYQRQAENLFNRMIVAGDIYNQKNARVTEALMRTVAKMFMSMTDMGPMLKEFRATGDVTNAGIALSAAAKALPTDEHFAFYQEMLQKINTYHEWRNPGAELAGLTPGRRQTALEGKLGAAENDYSDVMRDYINVVDEATEKVWTKKYLKVQKALDDARRAAKQVAIRVRYWDNELGDFVPEEKFNYEAVVKKAQESPIGQEAIKRNKGNKKAVPTDTPKVYKDMKKLSPAESKRMKTLYQERAAKLARDKADSHYEQASENMMTYESQIEQMFPDNPIEQLYRSLYQHFSETNQLAAMKEIDNKLAAMNSDTFTFGGSYYRSGKMSGGNAPGLEQRGFIDRAAEKASATARRGKAGFVFNVWETKALNSVGGFAGLVQRLITRYAKEMPEDGFAKAVRAAVGGRMAIDAVDSVPVQEVAKALYSVIDEAIEMVRSLPLTKPTVLRDALVNRLGGIMEAGDFSRFESLDDILDNMFEVTPIGPKPSGKSAEAWDEMVTAFNKQKDSGKGVDELQVLTRTIDALFFVASQHNLAMDLTKRFGWEAYGFKSLEEAKRAGFVRLKQVGGKSFELNDYLPGGDAAYFDPEVAPMIAASMRAWDKTYSDPTAQWLRSMMGVMSALKATQTVLRPGHWVANFFGDASVAFMDGMKPSDLAKGYQLSVTFAKEQIGADWARGAEGIDAAIKRSLGNIRSLGEESADAYKFSDKGTALVIGGKRVYISQEELSRLFADTNVFVKDFAANDSDGARWLIESMLGGNQTEQAKNAMLAKWQKFSDSSRIARTWQNFVKPAGDFTAYLGNGIRGGHALNHITSRSWSSMEELVGSLNEMVNLYHPTIQSLSAAERKAPRMLFTYYTWLRGAHATFLELVLNRTAAMMIPSKVFYNQAVVANEESATSIGNLWGDKSKTPGYLDYSVYGPTGQGPRGGSLYKPSILPLDVLDTWNIQFDSTLPPDANLFAGLSSVGRTIGSSSNILMQPAAEFITGTDLKTGKPSQVKDLATAGDRVLGNIGFMQILKGMGIYTPQNKIDNKTNPLTDRDRQLAGLNWWTGLKFGDVDTASNVKNARTEDAARKKRIVDILNAQLEQGK